MTVPATVAGADGTEAVLLHPASAERAWFERELLARGGSLPVQDRGDWVLGPAETAFVGVRGRGGEPLLGCSIRQAASRALPGFRIGRVRRLGSSADAVVVTTAVRALRRFAASDPRLLRLHVELFIPDARSRDAVLAGCLAEGFAPAPAMRSYGETILIGLAGSDDEQFMRLSKTGRQNVRAIDKHPVAVHAIMDASWSRRLDELVRETMARTGGAHGQEDWPGVIAWCNAHPSLGRLVGLFDERPDAPEPLLAFALGWCHGEFIEYATAASTRNTDLRISLAYGLAWDLIRWGKATGARWFDFGGVTRGSAGGPDALGGISDFKRYFSTNVVQVGAEVVLEPHRMAAAAARASGRVASWLSSLRRGAGQ